MGGAYRFFYETFGDIGSSVIDLNPVLDAIITEELATFKSLALTIMDSLLIGDCILTHSPPWLSAL